MFYIYFFFKGLYQKTKVFIRFAPEVMRTFGIQNKPETSYFSVTKNNNRILDE